MRDQGQYTQEIDYLKTLAQQDKDNRLEALLWIGEDGFLYLKDYGASISAFEQVLAEIPPESKVGPEDRNMVYLLEDEAVRWLAQVLSVYGDTDATVNYIRSLCPINASPEHKAENLDQVGTLCYLLKKYPDAASALEEELTVVGLSSERKASGLYYLGLCRYHLGDTASAKIHLTSVIDQFPTSQLAQDARAILYVWSRL